ncbi:hypothetical protein PLEOSDRAFT_1101281 [Pleurotus ostreatus PC15]|uniref:F-box domain-containing protein n=2 Tax=Pleurotus TaxID=5320 RepID=A0A067P346_PLEO1|nr:hypothetical protein PLEOSDRAFT_1101281 [Pleurotus ostreatus PC15]
MAFRVPRIFSEPRPTRPHLFGSFTLNCALDNSPLAGRKLCDGLLRVLDGSPHLARCFRYIELFIYASSQLAHDPALHSVLRRFPSVQTLIFRTFTDEWSRLPIDLVSSLHRIISSPSFERLEIHRVRFAPRAPELAVFLNHCARSLRYLTLVGVSYDGTVNAPSHGTREKIPQLTNLREMKVFGNSTNQTLLAMACDMPNLRRYHQNTNISSAWWQPVYTIVQPCIPPSVSDLSLTIRLPVFFLKPDKILQFPHFWEYTEMRQLTLILATPVDGLHLSALRTLEQFFAAIPPNTLPRLESFTIELPVRPSVNESDWQYASVWEKASANLGPLVEVGSLTSVSLVLKLTGYAGPTAPPANAGEMDLGVYEYLVRVVSRIEVGLHRLCSKGVLSVKFGNTSLPSR